MISALPATSAGLGLDLMAVSSSKKASPEEQPRAVSSVVLSSCLSAKDARAYD